MLADIRSGIITAVPQIRLEVQGMSHDNRPSGKTVARRALPGLWREEGGLLGLVHLDIPAQTPGMIVVAKRDEAWRTRPELCWQVWPDLLVPDVSP